MKNTLGLGAPQRDLLCNGVSGFLFGVFGGLRSLSAGLYRRSGEPFYGPRPWVLWGHCICSTRSDAVASNAASLPRFSSLVPLLPLDTVLDFCRLDRPDGNGFAP